MKYKAYITDLHLNLHPEQIDLLEKWYNHCKKVEDFFTIAYYPYKVNEYAGGFCAEDEVESDCYNEQWKRICSFLKEQFEKDGYISFVGFEWQGTGKDGDHNVYFKDYDEKIMLPSTYGHLLEEYKDKEAIAIPHHLAYSPMSRGKNWKTHNEQFSPVVEIYSHHGSSESDSTSISMDRHIHMGPRVEQSSVISGLKNGYHFGIIASGDNHEIPAMVKNGRACVWAEEYTKDSIWSAIKDRRVGGFTQSKILVWLESCNKPMGSIIQTNKEHIEIRSNVCANSKLERIELYKNGDLSQINLIKPKPINKQKPINIKFRIEMGWGPNIKYFPEYTEKHWSGSIKTDGKILSIEPIYSSFNNDYEIKNSNYAVFNALSRKNSPTHWMGGANMNTEGFIFELETNTNDKLIININGIEKVCSIQDMLNGSSLIVFEDEAKNLIKKTAGSTSNSRSDYWYNNAYKVKIYQAFTQEMYQVETFFNVTNIDKETSYFIKAIQSDGQTGWSSPIWIKK